MKFWKTSLLLYLLSLIAFVDAFFLYTTGANNWPHWFNPFMGMLIIACIPFLGAMIAMYPDKRTKENTDDISRY